MKPASALLDDLLGEREPADAREGAIGEGDTFAMEPGIHDPEAGWAVRLEDTHDLGPQGVEVLSPRPYAPDPWAR